MDLLTNPLFLGLLSIVILVFSAILHEVAHGYVADRFGDPTARLMGRLTLNPRVHIDPFMSVILPLMLIISGSPVIFGGAKPVPVDPFNLRDGRKDIALVSLAGPLTNIAIAILASVIAWIIFPNMPLSLIMDSSLFGFIVGTIIRLNVLLAIFNLIPIPPLDGSKVFALLLPEKTADTYLSFGSIGTFVILFLLIFPIGGFALGDIIFQLYSTVLSLLGF
jgi:Zn-dependent protease